MKLRRSLAETQRTQRIAESLSGLFSFFHEIIGIIHRFVFNNIRDRITALRSQRLSVSARVTLQFYAVIAEI